MKEPTSIKFSFKDLKRLGEMNDYFNEHVEETVSDKTKVRGVKWWKLKHDAMMNNFEGHEWYKVLSEEERWAVSILRLA